jgi:hypothetical protein
LAAFAGLWHYSPGGGLFVDNFPPPKKYISSVFCSVVEVGDNPLDAPTFFLGVHVRVLVACEYSGTVRDAFLKLGHDAMSCDLLPTDVPGPHYQGDVFDIIGNGWDLMIAHPPCTHLAISGARHFPAKIADGRQQEGVDFFMRLASADIPKIAIENPICIMSSVWRKPDQVIQPWQFGHGETKATCLWLKGLPRLFETDVVKGREQRIWTLKGKPAGMPKWKFRSTTYQGIADAMAEQWGGEFVLH